MQLGVVGLGRMGGNIVRRLMNDGHQCIVYDANPEPGKALAAKGAHGRGLAAEAMLEAFGPGPRAVWVMLPSGEVTDDMVMRLAAAMATRRHHHRWRQLLLQGRYPPRQAAGRAGHALCRCAAPRAESGGWSAATA